MIRSSRSLKSFVLITSLTMAGCDGAATRRAEAEKCNASPECVAREAEASTARASRSTRDLVRAPSGNTYFRGTICRSECATVREGYEFARAVELNNPDGCASKGAAFLAGCKTYYDEAEPDRFGELEGGDSGPY